MKKYLLVLFIVLVFSSLAFGQNSIDFTEMGLRGSGGSSDNAGEIGETISVSFSYDYSGITNPNKVYNNTGSGNTNDEIVVIWYRGSSWSARIYDGFNDGIAASNVSMVNSTGSGSGSYNFILPSPPTGLTTYFQIFYGCSAPDGFGTYWGDQMTSADDFSGFSAVNNAPTSYFTYMEFVPDTTETPTMTSPADGIHDDNPTDIQFTLPETAYTGSVKLSFTRSGENHECTIESEAQGIHSFTINPASLSSASEIELVTGGNSLTANVAYTVTIEYEDELQNGIASDSNTGYVYDTITIAPTFDLPASSSVISDEFTIQYDQPETAYEGSVKLTFTRTGGTTDVNSPHELEVLSETAGTNIQFNLKAANLDGLGGGTYVYSSTGNDILVDGAIYTIAIEYQDLFQHTVASDQNTGITYSSVVIEVSGGDYNAGTSFNAPSSNNAFFWIYFQKTGSGVDPTVDEIDFNLDGDYGSSDIVNLQIWSSSNNSFEDDIDVSLVTVTDLTNPIPFDFSPDQVISSAGVYYFFTVDVSATASGVDAIGATLSTSSWITASTSVSGDFPITGSTHPLPVTLTSFTVALSGQPVINWETQSETNNAYWNIYRGISQNMGQAIQINYGDMILGQGTATEPTYYSYTDNFPVLENTTYWYWLECVDNAGEADYMGPVSLFIPEGNGNNGTPATPDDYGLKQNYPNPFNPDTRINFALIEDSPVQLTIYNIKGEKVKTIFEEFVPADMVQTAYWDGKDASGKTAATGVYLYRLRTNKTDYMKRMLLMK